MEYYFSFSVCVSIKSCSFVVQVFTCWTIIDYFRLGPGFSLFFRWLFVWMWWTFKARLSVWYVYTNTFLFKKKTKLLLLLCLTFILLQCFPDLKKGRVFETLMVTFQLKNSWIVFSVHEGKWRILGNINRHPASCLGLISHVLRLVNGTKDYNNCFSLEYQWCMQHG